MVKVKRFIGHYPEFDDGSFIEILFNKEDVEIIDFHQSAATSTTDGLMIVTTIIYEDCS